MPSFSRCIENALRCTVDLAFGQHVMVHCSSCDAWLGTVVLSCPYSASGERHRVNAGSIVHHESSLESLGVTEHLVKEQAHAAASEAVRLLSGG